MHYDLFSPNHFKKEGCLNAFKRTIYQYKVRFALLLEFIFRYHQTLLDADVVIELNINDFK